MRVRAFICMPKGYSFIALGVRARPLALQSSIPGVLRGPRGLQVEDLRFAHWFGVGGVSGNGIGGHQIINVRYGRDLRWNVEAVAQKRSVAVRFLGMIT